MCERLKSGMTNLNQTDSMFLLTLPVMNKVNDVSFEVPELVSIVYGLYVHKQSAQRVIWPG